MFLSFIIPVYNTEEYLDECLQSLLSQDIPTEDYEIICVNDGSTDGSLEILRRYERVYSNVKVIDQKNVGVCRARNVGLAAAKGNFIWYIDADDLIKQNVLACLKQELLCSNCDRMIISSYHFVSAKNGTDDSQINAAWKNSVVWRSIFRRDFLNMHGLTFRYPELSFGEDALYMYEVCRALPETAEYTDPVYYHRERLGSLSTEMSHATEVRRLQCGIREAEIMRGYYEQGGVLETETANRFMSFLWGSLFRILMIPGNEAKEYLNDLKKKGLYPYPKPKECTLTKCPEINRNDLLGKLMDFLYTNLSSRWGYHGMRLIQLLFRMKQKIVG